MSDAKEYPMIVQMGNATPHPEIVDHSDPVAHVWTDQGAGYTHVAEGRPNGKDAYIHVLSNVVTHLPDHEAFVSITRDWPLHSPVPPSWVWSDDPDLAQMLSEAYGCPVGIPDDVEATHHTPSGPPGVGPPAEPAPEG